ncbi:MAG TPA: calcium-binding protein [Tepidisphaeraceae bacterium]|jgi:Ca2+-binding RTX toxin-like protein
MHVQSLETRRLLAVTVTDRGGGVVLVEGSGSGDRIEFSRDGLAVRLRWVSQGERGRLLVGRDVNALRRVVVIGGNGNDVIVAGRLRVPMRIYGGAGRDTISGGGRRDLLAGDGGADVIYDGAGNDFLDGGAGRDTLIGTLGDDTLRGGAQVDYLFNAAGSDTFYNNGPDAADDGSDDLLFTETPGAAFNDRLQFDRVFDATVFGKRRNYLSWTPISIDPLGSMNATGEKEKVDGVFAYRPGGSGDVLVDVNVYLDGGPASFRWSGAGRRGPSFTADCDVQYDQRQYDAGDFVAYNLKQFNLGPLPDGTYTFNVTNDDRGVGGTTFTVTNGWRGQAAEDRVYAANGKPTPVL